MSRRFISGCSKICISLHLWISWRRREGGIFTSTVWTQHTSQPMFWGCLELKLCRVDVCRIPVQTLDNLSPYCLVLIRTLFSKVGSFCSHSHKNLPPSLFRLWIRHQYDSHSSRFVSVKTVVFLVLNPNSLVLYSFCCLLVFREFRKQ